MSSVFAKKKLFFLQFHFARFFVFLTERASFFIMIAKKRKGTDMDEQFLRSAMLFGEEGIARLQAAHVALFGIGGVGGACAEALVRAGIGTLTVVDADTVAMSNLNRQTVALHSTIGQPKTQAAAKRLLDINPALHLIQRPIFFAQESCEAFDFSAYDFCVDAIDSVKSKLLLAQCCKQAHTPLVCCLGTGNKTDPSRLRITDLYQTSMCPLARVMRYECRKRGIEHLPVVFSDEAPLTPRTLEAPQNGKRTVPGSTSFVPPAAGMLLASYVVRRLLGLC